MDTQTMTFSSSSSTSTTSTSTTTSTTSSSSSSSTSSSIFNQPILSLSNGSLDQLQHADMSDLGNIWSVFNKCKSYIENGQRLEYMSWRLWQYQRYRIESNPSFNNNTTDNTMFQQVISNLKSSPVHDAYPHEVPQSFQKCYPSTIHNHERLIEWTPTDEPITPPLSNSSYDKQQTRQHDDTLRCSEIIPCTSLRMITPPLEKQLIEATNSNINNNIKNNNNKDNTTTTVATVNDDNTYDDDDDYDDEDDDYFLSDEDYDDDDDLYDDEEEEEQDKVNYSFVNDFKKTKPRPATPRRSLLSDLLQKQCPRSSSASPQYHSNQYLTPSSSSNTSFEQDLSQSLRDSIHRETWFSSSDGEHQQQNTKSNQNSQVTCVHRKSRNDPSESRWLESFHGW